MGKLSREKGKSFERLIAIEMRELYGPGVKRTLMAQARSGTEASDLEGTPWSIECKHNKSCTIQAAFRQATEAGLVNGKPPLVISRDNRSPILVTMSLNAFKALIGGQSLLAEAAEEASALRELAGELLDWLVRESTCSPPRTLDERLALTAKAKALGVEVGR